MNNEQTEKSLKILKKRIKNIEKQISNLKTIGFELNTPNKIVSYNVLIRKYHRFLISQLKKRIDLYHTYQIARSNQNLNISSTNK